jgi:hypothetical protein
MEAAARLELLAFGRRFLFFGGGGVRLFLILAILVVAVIWAVLQRRR